jgi:hypothetical protein
MNILGFDFPFDRFEKNPLSAAEQRFNLFGCTQLEKPESGRI